MADMPRVVWLSVVPSLSRYISVCPLMLFLPLELSMRSSGFSRRSPPDRLMTDVSEGTILGSQIPPGIVVAELFKGAEENIGEGNAGITTPPQSGLSFLHGDLFELVYAVYFNCKCRLRSRRVNFSVSCGQVIDTGVISVGICNSSRPD
jgi:hypothetical protein